MPVSWQERHGVEKLDKTLDIVPMPSSPPVIPETLRRADERLICLSESAGEKVRTLFSRDGEGPFLRVAVSGGGCNGLSYKLKYATESKKGDLLVESKGVPVLVDMKSALYLKGTHLDYSAALVSGGFKFSNPNAKASCSCGESFSV